CAPDNGPRISTNGAREHAARCDRTGSGAYRKSALTVAETTDARMHNASAHSECDFVAGAARFEQPPHLARHAVGGEQPIAGSAGSAGTSSAPRRSDDARACVRFAHKERQHGRRYVSAQPAQRFTPADTSLVRRTLLDGPLGRNTLIAL